MRLVWTVIWKSTSKYSESALTTLICLFDFLEALPAPLPLIGVLCLEDVLCPSSSLGVAGVCENGHINCDLVLGLLSLEVDAMGLSAIRHFTIH